MPRSHKKHIHACCCIGHHIFKYYRVVCRNCICTVLQFIWCLHIYCGWITENKLFFSCVYKLCLKLYIALPFSSLKVIRPDGTMEQLPEVPSISKSCANCSPARGFHLTQLVLHSSVQCVRHLQRVRCAGTAKVLRLEMPVHPRYLANFRIEFR